MNWINKIKQFGENIKKNIKKKFPTAEEQENSKWRAQNCCNSGPVREEELKENFYQCKNCMILTQLLHRSALAGCF